MAAKDLDIEQIASYLHLNVEQVTKLVERGKLPGRRVGGQWRFAEAEIHHWLEERIGLSDADELGEVRKWLDRLPNSPHESSDRFEQLLPLSCIAVPLHAKTRGSVIREMCDFAPNGLRKWRCLITSTSTANFDSWRVDCCVGNHDTSHQLRQSFRSRYGHFLLDLFAG